MFNSYFSSKAMGKWCWFYGMEPSIQTATNKPALNMILSFFLLDLEGNHDIITYTSYNIFLLMF